MVELTDPKAEIATLRCRNKNLIALPSSYDVGKT